MLGLQTSFMKFVHGLRIDELNISKKFRTLLVWNMAFGECNGCPIHLDTLSNFYSKHG